MAQRSTPLMHASIVRSVPSGRASRDMQGLTLVKDSTRPLHQPGIPATARTAPVRPMGDLSGRVR